MEEEVKLAKLFPKKSRVFQKMKGKKEK